MDVSRKTIAVRGEDQMQFAPGTPHRPAVLPRPEHYFSLDLKQGCVHKDGKTMFKEPYLHAHIGREPRLAGAEQPEEERSLCNP